MRGLHSIPGNSVRLILHNYSRIASALFQYHKELYVSLWPRYRRIIDMLYFKAERLSKQHARQKHLFMRCLFAHNSVFAYLAFARFKLRLNKYNGNYILRAK